MDDHADAAAKEIECIVERQEIELTFHGSYNHMLRQVDAAAVEVKKQGLAAAPQILANLGIGWDSAQRMPEETQQVCSTLIWLATKCW